MDSNFDGITISLVSVDWNIPDSIITDQQTEIVYVVNYVFLCGIVSLFGTVANVINLTVFYKQGLSSSINISFFAMAISDLCSLIMQQWFNVCVNPLFYKADVSIVPLEFQYITGSVPREVFAKITCLITVYITAERCICIIFPLRVKQMITPTRTTIAMIIIYSFTFFSVAPIYFLMSINWKFYPDRNITRLGLVLASNSEKIQEIVYIVYSIISLFAVVTVVIFTAILIRKLGQKNTWRKTANADKSQTESMSNRDIKTMKMVVLIASILILCCIPCAVLLLVTFFEPEFSVVGRYSHLFLACWSIGFLFESVNSSVNIVLYYQMSTKYRNTLREIMCTFRQLDNDQV